MEKDEINRLIKAVRSGKARDFSQLVREFGLQVRAFVHSRVQNRADAEDIAQQVFISAYKGLDKFDTSKSFEAWLIGIAKNRVLMHFRTSDRRQSAHERFREECLTRIGADLDEVEETRTAERIAALMDCVEKLPERMRRVVRARLRGEAGQAIADTLNITRNALYMISLRANNNLRDCVAQRLP
ncbi:sigma-70 family RNA polymerase sigma factor [Akkermansiaceae bacterium]|nr:sigma-70 family RNA polymerase sigma factor [Akkermansiaceae bacterium]